MKIGIIGAGNIGGTLAKVWAAQGHEIQFGVRDASSAKTQKALAEVGGNIPAVSIAEAAAFGEIIVLAVPNGALKETAAALGNVSGKIIIDTTNRIGAGSPDDGNSAAEDIAKWAPGARVVKAFNTMGWNTLLDPMFGGYPATVFICGDDASAKETVTKLAQAMGLQTVDAGPLSNAHDVESMARMWVYLMRNGMGRDFAFTLIRRS